MKKIIYIFILCAFTTISLNAQKLIILHTNDTHSQITPQTAGSEKGLGGYERRENFINSIRKDYPKTL